MTEPNGHVCPECAAPRAPDGSPSCACTQRASDALRDARTAEAAAAEDFDPLRIRPYVELEPGDADPAVVRVSVAVPGFSDDASASTMRLAAVPSGAGAPPPDVPPRPGRLRRVVLLGVAGAVVTVVAAAGFASGLFSYDTPSRDGALPDAVRASVPEASPSTSASASPSASTSSSPPAQAAPPPSAPPSRSPSRSATVSSTPSPSVTPSQTPTTERATGSAEATGDESDDELQTETLRRGDEGPEVTELQLRLTQLALYVGNADGDYDNQVEESVRRYQWARGITADDLGVYGGATRTSLEAETTEP
ncbi:peptidoglycan-binding protein [Streptomyces sp. NPDC058614]|uniref:peptidoglycan-binding domain-containing protein n=1 Tax=Streptomyces sp. NPDC058614 TaxID=3346557 RepID=UPI00364F1FD6